MALVLACDDAVDSLMEEPPPPAGAAAQEEEEAELNAAIAQSARACAQVRVLLLALASVKRALPSQTDDMAAYLCAGTVSLAAAVAHFHALAAAERGGDDSINHGDARAGQSSENRSKRLKKQRKLEKRLREGMQAAAGGAAGADCATASRAPAEGAAPTATLAAPVVIAESPAASTSLAEVESSARELELHGAHLSLALRACLHVALETEALVAACRQEVTAAATGPTADSSAGLDRTALLVAQLRAVRVEGEAPSLPIPPLQRDASALRGLKSDLQLQLALLCHSLVRAAAEVLPQRLAGLVQSLPRSVQTAIEGYVARQVTPRLFSVQARALRAVLAEAASVGAPSVPVPGARASEAATSLLAVAVDGSSSAVPGALGASGGPQPLLCPAAAPASGLHAAAAALAAEPSLRDARLAAAAMPREELARWVPAADEDADGFSLRFHSHSRDIVASYRKDEALLQLRISLPPAFPLQRAVLTCERRMGVTEEQWRLWERQMATLLSTKVRSLACVSSTLAPGTHNQDSIRAHCAPQARFSLPVLLCAGPVSSPLPFLQDGSLLQALQFWKHNLDLTFKDVEACPICFAIIHMSTRGLPRTTCATCKNKFHAPCLYTWFKNSNGSTCPLCRSQFR